MRNVLYALAAMLLCASAAFSQTPVALAPVARQQFFSATNPSVALAGGKLCTYNAGTTTPAATYVDINGVIQNSNPIVLDSSGYATIYLANQEYKFVLYDGSGNSSCPNSGVQEWAQDNVSAFQVVVGTQTIIFAGVTMDPSGQAGMVDYRTDLGRLRFFNSSWDSIPGLSTTDTFANKTIALDSNTVTNSVNTIGHYPRNNGVQYVDSAIQSADLPAVIQSYTNNGAGTGTNLIAKLTGAPSTVTSTATTDTGGAIGICVAGCGTSGTASISTIGQASCVFDGSVTAGDYVQISSSVAGDCHDAGITFPIAGQVMGRVLVTNASPGTYAVTLFGTEVRSLGTTDFTIGGSAAGSTSTCQGGTPSPTCFYYIFPNAHTLVRFVVTTSIAQAGCSPAGVYGVYDITAGSVLASYTPSATGVHDSGALSVSVPATHTIGIGITTSASGCSPNNTATFTATLE